MGYISGAALVDPFYEPYEVDNDGNKPRYYYENALEDWVIPKFNLYNTALGQYRGGNYLDPMCTGLALPART